MNEMKLSTALLDSNVSHKLYKNERSKLGETKYFGRYDEEALFNEILLYNRRFIATKSLCSAQIQIALNCSLRKKWFCELIYRVTFISFSLFSKASIREASPQPPEKEKLSCSSFFLFICFSFVYFSRATRKAIYFLPSVGRLRHGNPCIVAMLDGTIASLFNNLF